ncbi:MAG: PIG-L family deacetylase [Deltaproteobacteria bacterium]|nr:PIG-L family deacetylase [Deltaproteobacteria bacterium]
MKTGKLRDAFEWRDLERVIVLSPHLDDAALSCGGLLLALRAMGVPRLVVSVCCGNPPARPSPEGSGKSTQRRGYVSPRKRRAEDVAAMRMLGSDYVHLGFADGVYRRSPLTGELVYRHPRERWVEPRIDDAAFVEELYLLLRRLCLGLGRVLLVVPLGIGQHVDHAITGRVALRLAADLQFLWYEDFPYVIGRGVSPWEGDHPIQALSRLRRVPVARLALPFRAARKAALLECYRTQLSPLFGGTPGMREAVGRRTLDGRPCEFYWRARPASADRGAHIRPPAAREGG